MSAPYPNPWSLGLAPGTPQAHIPLSSEGIQLEIRQQPKEALLTSEGKEKARKPVDPPPIIQLKVDGHADPNQHFLQSPYLFMCVTLWHRSEDRPLSQDGKPALAGSLVSSLHRLKDVDNRDGGFFVFGDVSVKVQGEHRLHFSLFDLHKDTNEVFFLKSITSMVFNVKAPKDFKGMDESTYLSRAFSDQGVRLRLRKEPRAMVGSTARKGYSFSRPEEQDHRSAMAVGAKGPYHYGSPESAEPRSMMVPATKRTYNYGAQEEFQQEEDQAVTKRQCTFGGGTEDMGSRWAGYVDRPQAYTQAMPYTQTGYGNGTSSQEFMPSLYQTYNSSYHGTSRQY